jgi:hypothetical protein
VLFRSSTEWGVPTGTVAIAIPFYLAYPHLTDVHADRVGYIEGTGRADLLRYLRHEMGHVVNYAYRLFDRADWVKTFGSMSAPYREDYRPKPFSKRYVRHLPGWYAQKHPDEDWAETFAVWMTPGKDWRTDYAGWPGALAKLEFCDRLMAEVRDKDPLVTAADLDEDVSQISQSIDEFYAGHDAAADGAFPPGLDAALLSIFEDVGQPEADGKEPRLPASQLIAGLEKLLLAEVYRWTGHFPERTRPLLRHLQKRADELKQVYPRDREREIGVALTTFVTALAMNEVHTGEYLG